MEFTHQQQTALYVSAFFDELACWGVRDVVVSPGSRSTALAMCAYEMSRRFPERLRMYVDVDERGAAFFALGLAKASGRPAALVCTSGTAVANYYPAVVEAATSRVPLVVLSGDRPLRMQGLGAPQTCDQVKAFGSYVRAFRQMPEPCADARSLAFARQAAREAVLAAAGPGAELPPAADTADAAGAAGGFASAFGAAFPGDSDSAPCAVPSGNSAVVPSCGEGSGLTGFDSEGVASGFRESGVSAPASVAPLAESSAVVASRGCSRMAGPVHLNFPFDEPLKPDFSVEGLFEAGRRDTCIGALRSYADGSALLAAGEKVPSSASETACRDARRAPGAFSPVVSASGAFAPRSAVRFDRTTLRSLAEMFRGRRALALAGEGTCETLAEAREVVRWAQALRLPLLADPLSGLRSCADACVIDNYDNVMRADDVPLPEVVLRFGRHPVSKSTNLRLAGADVFSIVVDAGETRDWSCATDCFVACTPLDFVRQDWGGAGFGAAASGASAAGAIVSEACASEAPSEGASSFGVFVPDASASDSCQAAFFDEWVVRNDAERERILAAAQPGGGGTPPFDAGMRVHEGELAHGAAPCNGLTAPAEATVCGDGVRMLAQPDYEPACSECAVVRTLCDLAPANSLLFSANSMSIRAVDTFLVKEDKPLAVLCNRGQNGIDGTVSTALGAAQMFEQTTFLTGDFTMLHDLNALALQRELLVHHGPGSGEPERSIVVVLLNNNGGAIFDMLPQRSDDPYFERLFLVPQDVDFSSAAAAFGVPYKRATTLSAFAEAYRGFLGTPGISLVEVNVPLRGVRERYAPYQG